MEYEQRIADPIVASIGGIGLWQSFMILMIFLTELHVAYYILAQIFFRPKPSFTCYNTMLGKIVENDCSAICENRTIKGSDLFPETISTEFELVCDQEYLINLSQTLVMLGGLIGGIIFGITSDKIGRKLTLVICLWIQFISSLAVAFSPYFWMFMLFRFLAAFPTGGSTLISFVLLMEILGPKYRDIFGVLFQLPFNIGHLTLPLVSYLFRPWRHYQLALTLTSLYIVPYHWLLTESPRWLFATGQIDRTVRVLEVAAKCNNRPLDNIRGDVEEAYKRAEIKKAELKNKQGLFSDYFRYPVLRKKVICMSYNWFVTGLCYYGVSEYIGDLGGNIFINVAISGAITIPSTIMTVPMGKYWGRKRSLILTNLLIGIFMLFMPLAKQYQPEFVVVLAVLTVFAGFSSFVNVYVYSGELYPTVIRNFGMGMNSVASRVGGMLGPFVTSTGSISYIMPPLIYGIVAIVGALLTLLLPETKGKPLPNTIEEEEELK